MQDVKERLAIEDVISEYVQLKRAGRNFKGLSPFTSEKTPSFVVSPEKNIWHDFSSGKGGDVFSFVMEMEGLDFRGALELLARRAGVDLELYDSKKTGHSAKTKERLYAVIEAATKFYQAHLKQNKTALEYVLKQRKFTKDTVLEFRLGYSPNNGTALIDYLKKQKFTEKEMEKAGLTARRYRGLGDMFRGRLMVPLMDPQGRVLGFTARLLDDDPKAPKYINTPQTLLYDKSRHVFGLHLAKDALRKTKIAVIVEGNLDVIASHQSGVKNVVATAGTALTEMNLKAISRFTGDVRLAFDQDRAGQAAAERAIPIAAKTGATLSIITIPEGKDPDELIKKNPKLWEEAIDNNQYAVDWLIDRYKSQLDLSTAVGKRQFSDIVLATIRRLPDTVEQDHYIAKLADMISVSTEALRSKFVAEKGSNRVRKQPKQNVMVDKESADYSRSQNQLLALTLMRPKLRSYLEPITDVMLGSKEAKAVLAFIKSNPDFKGDPNTLKELQPFADYVKMLLLQHEAMYQDLDEIELQYEIARLQVRLIEQYVKTKKSQLAAEMKDADEATVHSLLEQARTLDKLLKH